MSSIYWILQCSHSVLSNYLWPHGLHNARFPCPSATPRACLNSCALSRWCHPTISSSVVPFSSCFNLSQHQSLLPNILYYFGSTCYYCFYSLYIHEDSIFERLNNLSKLYELKSKLKTIRFQTTLPLCLGKFTSGVKYINTVRKKGKKVIQFAWYLILWTIEQ